MKKVLSILSLLFLCTSVLIAGGKKIKLLDHYFLDKNNLEVDPIDAFYEVKVFQDADSIVVCQWYAETETPCSVETFKNLTDSIQEKWGTQLSYYPSGKIHRFQFIDKTLGVDKSITYAENGLKESEALINQITRESLFSSWYPSGAKKSHTKRNMTVDNGLETQVTSWHENGTVSREQFSVNHETQKLKIYDKDGNVCLSIPCQKGDTIFMNSKMSVTSPKTATIFGIVDIVGDSTKINSYTQEGKILAEETYKNFTPENPSPWGTQRYYYATQPEKVDSIFVFKGINGANLIEKQYYPDGKTKSISTIQYDKVMQPIQELRQYFQSGQLRRVQKHVGEKLVEGHCYDSEGNEIQFFEFKE